MEPVCGYKGDPVCFPPNCSGACPPDGTDTRPPRGSAFMELVIEVSDEDGAAILEWITIPAPLAPGGHHRVFITSSVPAIHMWNIKSVRPT